MWDVDVKLKAPKGDFDCKSLHMTKFGFEGIRKRDVDINA